MLKESIAWKKAKWQNRNREMEYDARVPTKTIVKKCLVGTFNAPFVILQFSWPTWASSETDITEVKISENDSI